jgi:hypothetical protein
MVQSTDDDVTTANNVTPFPGTEPQRPQDPTGAERQARWRENNRRNGSNKKRRKNKKKASTVTPQPALTDAAPIAPTVTQFASSESVTGRSVAVRNAAREAATVAAPDSGYVARLLMLEPAPAANAVTRLVSVTVHDAHGVDNIEGARAPGRRHGGGIRLAALTAALALATISGGFSITGMTSIFVGSFWAVIGMGIALEAGKLSAVAWLGHQRGTASKPLRAALALLVAVLMGLNAVGCYGFLANAHIGHQVEGDVAVAGRATDVEARLAVQAEKVADLTKQIADLDAARTIETPSAGNLRTASAINAQAAALAAGAKLRAADDERRQAKRTSLADKLAVEAKALAELKIEKAKVDGDRKVAEADLGPVRYLATLLGAGDQDVLRWFILVVAILLDPAAVLLLLAATRR